MSPAVIAFDNVSKRYGGAELEFAAVVTFGALLARACASTSWVWVNYAAHHMMLGMFPAEAQDEIWKESRDALIASSFVFPAARAKKVEGGYVISGDPLEASPSYQSIVLYVDANTYQVRRVLLLDSQGNRNRFDFLNLLVGQPLVHLCPVGQRLRRLTVGSRSLSRKINFGNLNDEPLIIAQGLTHDML